MAEKSDKKVLFENTIAIALTQIVSYVMPLISLPYLSRVLGVEKFGLVFWAQACIQYFIMITDYGFNFSAVREISIERENKDKVSDIFASVMGVKACLVLICFIILSILVFAVPKFRSEWLLFYLTFFMVIGYAMYPIWYFQGIEHMKYVTFMKIVSQTIFLALIFMLIKSPADYQFVAILNSLGFIISGIISIYIAVKRFGLKLKMPEFEGVKYQFKHSFEFFFASISNTLYTNTNSFCLGLVANPVLVGYYIAAEKIYAAVHMLTAPIGTSLYPYISKTKNVSLFKKIFYLSLIGIIGICIFVFFFAQQIITIFYGTEMLNAYKTLRIFCITVFFSSISGLIGYPLVAAMGHSKIVNTSLPIAAIAHITCMGILFINNALNITTIAFLTILPYVIMLSIRVYGVIKYKLWNYKQEEQNV